MKGKSRYSGDWSLAGRQRRRSGKTGGWLVDWLRVLQRASPACPKVILMEFIYIRGDAEFERQLRKAMLLCHHLRGRRLSGKIC